MLTQLQIPGPDNTPGDKFYALADVPDDVMDIKAIDLESRLGASCSTADELMSKIPEVAPVPCEFLRAVHPEELYVGWRGFANMAKDDCTGIFKVIGLPYLEKLPRWEWNQIYNYASQPDA